MKGLSIFVFIFILIGCAGKGMQKEIREKEQVSMVENLDVILKRLEREGNLDAIIELYQQRQEDFRNSEMLLYVINAFFNKNRYEDVIKVLENKQDFFKKGLGHIDKISKLIGISYYKIGNYEQAQRFFEVAKNNSYDEDIILYLSLIYLKKSQYSNALIITSSLPEGKRELTQGLIQMEMKNWQRALQLFEKIKIYSERVQLYKAYCYFMLGDLDRAEKIINDLHLEKDFHSNLIKAILLVERGYVKKGIEILESLKVDGDERLNEIVNQNLGIIYNLYLAEKKR
ncbi:MAG: tetratricopeptide repeat protein [Proteobacteria bacterium]|nr:tetratricopeptide repeat protein [Pseudomonadota bacterium]